MTMPYWQILGFHAVLSVGLALTFTPVFTLGLGAVPSPLYSHASSILSTLQQVAGAIGTALVITIMSTRAETLRADGATPSVALLEGMRLSFLVGAGLAVAVIITALILPSRADEHGEGPRPAHHWGSGV